MNFEEIDNYFSINETRINKLVQLRDIYVSQKEELDNQLLQTENEIMSLDKVSSLFKHLLDVLLDAKKKEIENLVSYGLKTVFTDQNLNFKIDIKPKYDTIYTTFQTEKVGVVEGDALDNFGGGIINIESFLLRVITLFQTKMRPFLFLDESFSNLSQEYVENCSLLLKKMCEDLGLTICLVTHQDLMLSNADKVYKAGINKENEFFIEEKKQ